MLKPRGVKVSRDHGQLCLTMQNFPLYYRAIATVVYLVRNETQHYWQEVMERECRTTEVSW